MRVLLLSLLPISISATGFTYNNDFKCDSPVSMSVTSLDCGDGYDSVCEFGDELSASGGLSLKSAMPSKTCVTLRNCFMGVKFICKSYNEGNIDMCTLLGMESSSDDVACPAAGDYTFASESIKIPDVDMNLGSGWWVTSYVTVADCDDDEDVFTKCQASFKAVSSGKSSSSEAAALVGVSALVALLYYHKRRQRTVAVIDLAHEERIMDDSRTGHFEMMSDSVVRV